MIKKTGSLLLASRYHLSQRKSIAIWNTPDNDDTDIDSNIPEDSLLIFLEEKNEYYRVVFGNRIGWIHKNNTTDVLELDS